MSDVTTKKCHHCSQNIAESARKCERCRTWQGWRGWVFDISPVVMALLVALITVLTQFVTTCSQAVASHEDRVTVKFMGTDPSTGAVDVFFISAIVRPPFRERP